MDSQKDLIIAARLRDAITIGKMGLGEKDPLNMRIAANGPTIGAVIDKALGSIPENDAVNIEIALLKNDLNTLKQKLKEKTINEKWQG